MDRQLHGLCNCMGATVTATVPVNKEMHPKFGFLIVSSNVAAVLPPPRWRWAGGLSRPPPAQTLLPLPLKRLSHLKPDRGYPLWRSGQRSRQSCLPCLSPGKNRYDSFPPASGSFEGPAAGASALGWSAISSSSPALTSVLAALCAGSVEPLHMALQWRQAQGGGAGVQRALCTAEGDAHRSASPVGPCCPPLPHVWLYSPLSDELPTPRTVAVATPSRCCSGAQRRPSTTFHALLAVAQLEDDRQRSATSSQRHVWRRLGIGWGLPAAQQQQQQRQGGADGKRRSNRLAGLPADGGGCDAAAAAGRPSKRQRCAAVNVVNAAQSPRTPTPAPVALWHVSSDVSSCSANQQHQVQALAPELQRRSLLDGCIAALLQQPAPAPRCACLQAG